MPLDTGRWNGMPINEKEYNGNLFDQLSLIERIERHLKSGGQEAAEAEIEILKKKSTENSISSRQRKKNKHRRTGDEILGVPDTAGAPFSMLFLPFRMLIADSIFTNPSPSGYVPALHRTRVHRIREGSPGLSRSYRHGRSLCFPTLRER